MLTYCDQHILFFPYTTYCITLYFHEAKFSRFYSTRTFEHLIFTIFEQMRSLAFQQWFRIENRTIFKRVKSFGKFRLSFLFSRALYFCEPYGFANLRENKVLAKIQCYTVQQGDFYNTFFLYLKPQKNLPSGYIAMFVHSVNIGVLTAWSFMFCSVFPKYNMASF